MNAPRALVVGLDVSQIDNQSLGWGQYRYAVNLVTGLAAHDDIRLVLFGSKPTPRDEFARALATAGNRGAYVDLRVYRGTGYYYYDVLRLGWRARRCRVDVLHQFHTNIPLLKPCPVVVTGYHYFYDPPLFESRPHAYYRWALRHRTDLVIALSDATRRDFAAHYSIPNERMRTVYPGLSPDLVAGRSRRSERPYLLSPYNLSESKNLRALLLAWPEIAAVHPALQLVLYGRANVSDDREREFEALIGGLPGRERIHLVGHLDDATVGEYLSGCELFVFPSTIEGFGYPLAEAMANGACCIARDASAMREVGADAVCLVETRDPAAIASAALRLLRDPQERRTLGERARRRAARFTIETMTAQTVECYRLVSRPRRDDSLAERNAG